ncbi:hypothetical protein [Pseudomonas sp.]|uniref:hypothetical protein n=1 Tax=Pseudomonas sp. TaxID=306 RepID=UPI003FD778D7
MSVGINLSLSDMLLVDDFAEAFGKDNKPAIHAFLYENGLDVEQGVEEFICQHRNLRKEVVTCILYQGHSRMDTPWLKSGAASWEAIVESCDLELRIALKTIGQQQDSTASIINHMQKHAN